jgi:hypothetical protein
VAVLYLKQLVAGFPPKPPGSRVGSMWGLWWTKRHWGRFPLSISVSPANHSTKFSIIIITQGWHNRRIGGPSAEWTQMDYTAHYTDLTLPHRRTFKSLLILFAGGFLNI